MAKEDSHDAHQWEIVEKHLIRYGGEFARFFIHRAKGSYVYDQTGRAILDFTSGQMCAILGHNHPDILAAMQKSMDEVIHLFSGMITDSVSELAHRLACLLYTSPSPRD